MNDLPPLDKTAFSIVNLDEADEADRQYWWSKTPQERLQAVEIYRRMVYGHDRTTARLQRTIEVVDLEES